MRILKIVGTLLGTALMLAVVSPAARADSVTQESRLTFSSPIQIPGNKVLPAGTYWFAVPDPIGSPNTVAIYNANQKHLIAMVQTRPVWRQFRDMTDTIQLTLAQQSQNANSPDALVSWFYPGRADGHAFLYSHRMNRQLSEEQQVQVQVGLSHSSIAVPDRLPGSLGNS